jgi:FAM92 protein
MKDISDGEQFNFTTEKALENLANGFTFLADQTDLKIQRIEEKVLPDLSQYQIICQNAKEEVKNQVALRDREISKRKQLDITRRMKNENDIILSNMQISKILKEITTISEQFEAQKITDVKECLENFILIQMKYHASCIEVLTMVHQDITSIDEKKDVEVNLVFILNCAFLNACSFRSCI